MSETQLNQSNPPAYVAPGENLEPTEELPIPDDFKYSDIVAECDVDIRHRFLLRVYLLLALQMAFTVGIALVVTAYQPWVLNHTWTLIASGIGSFAFMIGAMVMRRKYPWNFLFLTLFTFAESWLIGVVTSLMDTSVVVNAFIITCVVFVGLSIFAVQTKYDFTGWAPYLCMFLFSLIGLGFMNIFINSSALELTYSYIAVVLFSVYIVVDTQMVMNRFHPEDVIPAVIELYLDIVNLFINLLRILSDSQ